LRQLRIFFLAEVPHCLPGTEDIQETIAKENKDVDFFFPFPSQAIVMKRKLYRTKGKNFMWSAFGVR